MQRFGIKGKLAPRYIGPYPIVERCGPMAYRLDLPANLSVVHNIFHVSQLKKYLRVPTEVVESDSIQLESDLTFLSILSRLLITRIELLVSLPTDSTKFSGVITPKMKLLGRRRNS